MYIGNSSILQQFAPAIDYFSGTGSATQFTLSRTVGSTIQVQVVIENVVQNPSSAYTIVGQTITFASAPPSGTNNIYVTYIAPTTQVTTLPQSPSISGSVTASGGYYAIGGFTGIYSDGSVLDYSTGLGRLSVGPADALAFYNGGPAGTETMRISSSGYLGIGTNNPTNPLTVQTPGTSTSVGGNNIIRLQSTSTGYDASIQFSDTITNSGFISMNSGNMIIGNYGSERLRIDTAGILGIGVIPSTWQSSDYKAIQIGSGGSAIYGGQGAGFSPIALVSNAYVSGGSTAYTYSTNSQSAGLYRIQGSSHSWGIAPAGTGTVSFTNAMSLDSSGNLSINGANYNTASQTGLTITDHGNNTNQGDLQSYIYFKGRYWSGDDNTANGARIGMLHGSGGGSTGSALAFYTQSTGGSQSGTERVRIDKDGNLLIGATATGTLNSSSQPRLIVGTSGAGGFGAIYAASGGGTTYFPVNNGFAYRVTIWSTASSISAKIGVYIFVGLNKAAGYNPQILTVNTVNTPDWSFSYALLNSNDCTVGVNDGGGNQGTRVVVENLGNV